MNSLTDRIGARLATMRPTTPSASILSYDLVSPTVAKVIVAHTFDGGVNQNRDALASVLGESASLIPNSFRAINTDNPHAHRLLSVGFVSANTLSEELTETRASALKEIAKNVLMDDHDNSMWQVTQASDGRKFIRRQHNEDLAELMATASVVNTGSVIPRRFTEISSTTVDHAGSFNYVAYVDVASHQVNYGYVVEEASAYNGFKATIQPRDSEEAVYVGAALIVEAAYNVDPNNRLTSAVKQHVEEAGIPDTEALKAYYRKEYGYGPEFLRELEAEIDQHAVA